MAVHQACQALRLGECDVALAGGVNLLISPATMISFSRARMLAPDGRCKTFDAAADGYVRAEGCGVVVVKRLADAIRDGDRIRAVIRGSAVNQDGASGGLTVPNGIAQQRVIAEALKRAGVAPGDVDYLEAHGTGTSLGDPIEVQAAGAVFGAGRDASRPLLIGSVKTNIGHLEAAAGMAGLIKVILSLEHEVLPKHLHFRRPSPHIPWDRLPVRVVEEAIPWERDDRPRFAGISSFGFSGTNAHVIVEEAPPEVGLDTAAPAPVERSATGRFSVLPLSARTPTALVEMAHRYRNWLTANPDANLSDVCLTAGVGRSHFEHRAALVVNSAASAGELLDALVDDRPAPGLVRGECGDPPKTAWLFPGQGSQYAGMARQLFDTEPVFQETVTRCATAVADMLERPMLDVIFGADSDDTLQSHLVRPTRPVRGRSGSGPTLAVLGHRTRCGAGPQCRSVLGGLCCGRVRSRGWGVVARRARPTVRQSATRRSDGRGVRRRRPGRELHRRVPASGGGGLQRCQHRAFRPGGGPGAGGGRVGGRWRPVRMAGHQPCLPLRAARSGPRRIRGVRKPVRVRLAAADVGVQPHRCGRQQAHETGRSVLASPCAAAHRIRQECAHARGARLRGVAGGRSATGAHRSRSAGMARRTWPRPRAIASLRRSGADHRQVSEALASAYVAGHRPNFAAHQQRLGRTVDLPTYPFQHRPYWYTQHRDHPSETDAVRTETVRLLEEGRIEELAALIGHPDGNGQTVGMLKQLADQHNQQRSAQAIADARYEIRWEKSAPVVSRPGTGEKGTWLLVADDADTVAPLADVLTAQGLQHRIVGLPQSDVDEEQLEAAIRAAAEDGTVLRILHLAGIDPDGAMSTQSLERMQHRVLRGTQRVLRAAATAGIDASLWLITLGAQHVMRGDTVSPAQSCLWGFGRTASFELSKLWGGLADLSAGGADEWSGLIGHILAAPASEDQIALRGRAVYLARLARRAQQQTTVQLELRGDATYLVTGGLGSVGLNIAEYLAAHGAGHLVLTGRRAPSDVRAAAHRRGTRPVRLYIPAGRRRRRRFGRRHSPADHHSYRTSAGGGHRARRR